MPQPLLSIVIANYNYGRFLEDAIRSIVNQHGFQHCELIVVDGGSTDDSVDTIKKHADKISWWCSEKDKGQSDAFNKGFFHARGKYGCWLNADDVMMPGALKAVISYINRTPKCEWLAGSSVFADSELKVKWCSRCVHVWRNGSRKFPIYSVNGPSSFFLIDNLKKAGGFDVSLRYTMDTDLWRRFVKAGIILQHLPNYVWCFRVHEESKTSHKFITGKGCDSFASEGLAMNLRYGITPLRNKIGSSLSRLLRLVSGAYLRSYIDTCRYKGKSIELIGR